MRLKSPQFLRLRKQASGRSADETLKPQSDETGQTPRKKLNQRRMLIAAVCAIAVLILGVVPITYSYLTASSDTVVNTFAGGAISLTLDEADVDTDGNPLEDEPRVQENTYKVVPGAELSKDPTVTVLKGSEVCYVYLYVENPLDENYFTLDYSEDWTLVATTGTKTLYVYKTTVDAADGDVALTPIFTTVSVSLELTTEQIEAMGEVKITVQAYAIQAEGVDSETSVQMAADYFETEFGFEWTDVDTAVEIDGLITEEEEASEETETSDDADTSSDTTEEESSAEDSTDVADDADSSTSDETSDETESEESSVSDEEADSSDTESDESSEDESAAESSDSSDSSDSSGSDASTESAESSSDTATLDLSE